MNALYIFDISKKSLHTLIYKYLFTDTHTHTCTYTNTLTYVGDVSIPKDEKKYQEYKKLTQQLSEIYGGISGTRKG